MLCTKCSETIKPVVALDIDGTLGNYHYHFTSFAIGWLGLDWVEGAGSPIYDGSVLYRDWFTSTFGVTLDVFRGIKLAYRQGGLKRTMPVYEGASDMTHKLAEAGAEIWMVTTRPYLRLDAIDPDTREWLRRHEIRYDNLLYGPDKWNRLAEQIDPERVAGVLDDDINRINEAHDAHGWHTILRRTIYNNAVYHGTSARTLRQARDLLLMSIQTWS